MLGFDFYRQKPMDNYIVDFFCNELMLAIEIDGDSHDSKVEYDKNRQTKLESLGLHLLRFSDLDVKSNMEGVISTIENWILGDKESV
jgi:very-short-patch-repair endonuclease